ncbi:MAG: cytochrome d ubiquinol oxidase subunit II [Gammaproteobacteria bacterium]|nr:cytochrome d ubiquinol oxidase subunit II [Gammaproteobacteria bacterium]
MIPIPFDYETLRVTWWLLLGVLLIGVAVMDGFDMGVAFLNPIIGRTDSERRIMINTVGPVWEGNQVWLITGAGAVFAAWPTVYATAFSGFYLAMFLLLISLILRPVSFEFRNKYQKRAIWDYALFLSGLLPPLIFGVAFGNLFLGVPFKFDEFRLVHYHDSYIMSFLHLLSPFALLTGLASVAMHTAHGAVYLAAKSRGTVQKRAIKTVPIALGFWMVLFVIGGVWVSQLDGYTMQSAIDHNGLSDPTAKTVVVETGVWLRNYQTYPILYLLPILALLASGATILLVRLQHFAWAFIPSSLTIAGTIATAGVALFPFLMTSSIEPSHSLTVWDASSSRMTLWLMTIATAIFMPIIIIYTSWVYRVIREPMSEAYLQAKSQDLY